MKKRSETTQTLRAGCSKAEPKISPNRRPITRDVGPPNFNQLEMVTYLYLQTQFGEDRCTQFRVNTHPQTGPITIHCVQCNNRLKVVN